MNITSAALQAAPPSWFYHRHRPFPLSTTKITIVRRISGATLLVLELLKKNRDMLFNEVKLTVLIEDPRDVERRRLLGIDDENAPTRDELADALVQVNEGKIPENRLALQMLAEEMLQWPNLEVEVQKKKPPGKSLYAKFTDTGINPVEAAKMLNMDWDSAAEIEDAEIDDVEVPPAVVGFLFLYIPKLQLFIVKFDTVCTVAVPENVITNLNGYGALYLITAFPVIIALARNITLEKERQILVDPISMQAKTEATSVLVHRFLPPAASGKFVSCSLPNSPRESKQKKKRKNQQSPLARQQSVALGNLERLRMQRSKSCGEGRASQPSMDLDLWHRGEMKAEGGGGGGEGEVKAKGKGEDKFKCGTCLFLPGLGKGKAAMRKVAGEHVHEQADVVSQRVSLEKFECGSWRLSAIINSPDGNGDDAAASNLFFDLPLELMRCASVNDVESPVTIGFLFDGNRKAVAKLGKSDDSRHVRFSSSSSPRLRKQRDDFTAFLEAQSA
ncbi:hypothetical protein SASPL_144524 [Salvia splendens]|uniref:Uncharacterized protein n=2 Tax=Salvia splendens TaxID=180675 RepID=A0A8X8WGJ0_SALSN|nr:hypothetical protein SASPL_144524 [Salvia splendens]